MVQSMKRIPVAGPSITERELVYVADAAANGWYAGSTTYHERFEKAFAEYLAVRYAVSLPSCTSAIHLALAALNIGPGDEVIVPDVTWIASAAPNLVRRGDSGLRGHRSDDVVSLGQIVRRDDHAAHEGRDPRRSLRGHARHGCHPRCRPAAWDRRH